MGRLLVLTVVVFIAAGDVCCARDQVWTIYDGTGGGWNTAETAAHFNDAGAGVELRVKATDEETSCQRLRQKLEGREKRRAIVACRFDVAGDYVAETTYCRGCVTIIHFDPESLGDMNVACHELMHALTHIDDVEVVDHPDSCVWGNLDHPGAFDVTYLREHLLPSGRGRR